MKFLGTGAGEGIPNPFCTCRICEYARKHGGKDIRTRSSFMLDRHTIIDMGADFFCQSFLYGEDFTEIENVLYTHTHNDHFNYTMIWERSVRMQQDGKILNVFFVDEGYDIITDFYLKSRITEGREAYAGADNVNFVKLEFGKKYSIGGYDITPLKGMHRTSYEQHSANYLIERDGKKLYYALDSGIFCEETFEKLKGAELDIFIGECTFPKIGAEFDPNLIVHMDLEGCLKNLEILFKNKTITTNTEIYLTHIGPWETHFDLCEYFAKLDLPYKINVACDGMEL